MSVVPRVETDFKYLLVPHEWDSKGPNEAVSGSASAVQIPGMLSITPNISQRRYNRAIGTRIQAGFDDDVKNDLLLSYPEVEMADQPATVNLLGLLCSGLCQNTNDTAWDETELVGQNYEYNVPVLNSAIADTVANEGYGFTLVKQSPENDEDEVVQKAVLRTLRISAAADANDGLVMIGGTFVGQSLGVSGNMAFTATDETLDDVIHVTDAVSAVLVSDTGSQDIASNILGFELELSNNAEFPVGRPGAGPINFPKYDGTVTIRTVGGIDATRDAFEKLLDQNGAMQFTVTFGSTGADGYLVVDVYFSLDSVEPDRTNSEIFTVSGAICQPDGSNQPVTFTIGRSVT